jgi:hypothetical protein
MCRTNYYNDKSHGGWRKVDKNVDNCYKIHPQFRLQDATRLHRARIASNRPLASHCGLGFFRIW